MSSICSYEVKRRPQLRHSRRRRMVAPSRLSRESTTRSWFSVQKGHFMPFSLLGVDGDVEAQEELLEARRGLDLHLEVADGIHHPVLLVLDLKADDEAAGTLEVAAPQRQLDGAGQLSPAVGGSGSRAGGRLGGWARGGPGSLSGRLPHGLGAQL